MFMADLRYSHLIWLTITISLIRWKHFTEGRKHPTEGTHRDFDPEPGELEGSTLLTAPLLKKYKPKYKSGFSQTVYSYYGFISAGSILTFIYTQWQQKQTFSLLILCVFSLLLRPSSSDTRSFRSPTSTPKVPLPDVDAPLLLALVAQQVLRMTR